MPAAATDRFSVPSAEETSSWALTQFINLEPVLARGIGRLTFEFTAPPMAARFDYAEAGNSSTKSINRFLSG
jgi:hypothetical protein